MREKKTSVQSPVSAVSEDGKHLHVHGVAVYQAYKSSRKIHFFFSNICSPMNLPQKYYLAGDFFFKQTKIYVSKS